MELLRDLDITVSNQMAIQMKAEIGGKLWELEPVADF